MTPLHPDEIPIDLPLVRGLVERQLPAYAALDLRPLAATGSSNRLFRLGPQLLVRLPRQPGGSATIEKEARWLPLVAASLTSPVPEVVAVGEPDEGYPERWAVTTWLEGRRAEVPRLSTSASPRTGLAEDLAVLVGELKAVPVPEQAQADPSLHWYRGGPLHAVHEDLLEAVAQCRRIEGFDLDLDAVLEVWQRALQAERDVPSAEHWYHGDLLAENLLVTGQPRLRGVLDFGGLAVGDPCVDLVVAWEVLDPAGREVFRQLVGADDASWLRGAGWALLLAVITPPYYWHTMPERCSDRLAMAANVLAEL
ncbi:MAG: aminoglycoside phosphotransferase family protein [Motilibacteraceae bacterium]